MSERSKPPRPGSMSDDDRALAHRANAPARGVPVEPSAPAKPWHEEPTGVHTDTQVFRAIKGLRDEIADNRDEAARAHGSLKQEVSSLSKRMDAFDGKLDDVMVTGATVSGKIDVLLAIRRDRIASGEMRATAKETAKETLAEQVLAEQRAAAAHERAVRLKLIGGIIGVLTSGAVVGALVHWLAS